MKGPRRMISFHARTTDGGPASLGPYRRVEEGPHCSDADDAWVLFLRQWTFAHFMHSTERRSDERPSGDQAAGASRFSPRLLHRSVPTSLLNDLYF